MNEQKEFLQLVRDGVERFILQKATMEDFLKAMRAIGKSEKAYSHQLTRAVFSKIVADVMRKRKRRQQKDQE